jgi:hypothetical protein
VERVYKRSPETRLRNSVVSRARHALILLAVVGVVAVAIAVGLTRHSGRSTPRPHPGARFVGDFESGDLTQWDHAVDPDPRTHPLGTVGSPVQQGRYAAQLTVDPSDSADEPGATRVDLFENARPGFAGEGAEEWERVWVLFPSAAFSPKPFEPVPGNWNWLVQWHSASRLIGRQSRTGGQPFALGVQTGARPAESRCFYSTRSSAGAELAGYFTGGDIASGPQRRHTFCTNRALRLDHWYEIGIHVIWSVDVRLGVFQLSVDGQPLLDLHGPTLLFNSRSGAVDLPNPDLSNYRGPDPRTNAAPTWSSTVFYDGLRLGPTAASVGLRAWENGARGR